MRPRPTVPAAKPAPAPQRQHSTAAAPAPPPAAAPPAAAGSQGPGLFGQMASTAAYVDFPQQLSQKNVQMLTNAAAVLP